MVSPQLNYDSLAGGAWYRCLTKSVKPERMAENIDVFDFNLTDEDMTAIAELDTKESLFSITKILQQLTCSCV